MAATRVAFYARVSGHVQEKEETVETQRYYLEQWAAANGHEVVGWYADTNIRSIVPIDERPEGGRLLRDAARRQFDIVAIYRLGRWSRYTQVWHDGKARLDAAGVDLHCLNEDIKDDTPGERFTLGVKLLVNELDRDTIAQNCLDGKYRRAHEGGYVGGIVPYGYRVAGGRRKWLEPDPVEAEVVRRIYQWLVEERMSCVQIARRLNALSVPTACQSQDETKHRRHCKDVRGLWTNSRVARLIRNPTYCGERQFGASNKGRRGSVAQKITPLVDAELWQRAQARLEENLLMCRRNAKHDYLLRGVVICAHCGRRCYGKTMNLGKGHPISYYVCNRKTLKYQGYEPNLPACPLPHVRAEELEADLWEKLHPYIQNPGQTIARIQERLQDAERDGHSLQESIDALRSALERKHAARRRAVSMATDGVITREELSDQMARLESEATDITDQIAGLSEQLSCEQGRERLLSQAEAWLQKWEADLSGTITREKKREAIEGFVERIELHATEEGIKPIYCFIIDPNRRSCVPNVTAYGSQLLRFSEPGRPLRRAA
jgi:site-specific DNA recombinase